MADPDLEWAMAAIFPSVISSFFTQNKGGGVGPPGPSLRPATVNYYFQFSLKLKLILYVAKITRNTVTELRQQTT